MNDLSLSSHGKTQAQDGSKVREDGETETERGRGKREMKKGIEGKVRSGLGKGWVDVVEVEVEEILAEMGMVVVEEKAGLEGLLKWCCTSF